MLLAPINQIKYNLNPQKTQKRNFFAPLKCDTVSFCAMKKTQFEGFNLAMIEKFKAPIQSFNTQEDFDNWADNETKKITLRDYPARQEITATQRKGMLDDWKKYVLEENDGYTPQIKLLILSEVTKDLKQTNDSIPPVLNKGVLAQTIYELESILNQNPKESFNFNKMYANNLQAFYLDDTDTGETGTKWIIIPSKEHDSENFSKNVEKLKALSYKTWCTKSYNAEPYLKKGDFHIFLEDGKPKVGIRFSGDKIEEIQGEKNNNKIPAGYADAIINHVQENDYEFSYRAQKEFETLKFEKKKMERIKEELKDAIKNKDTIAIMNYFMMEPEVDENGEITIEIYGQPGEYYDYDYLGIDEDELLKDVVKIKGHAYFENTKATKLPKLEYIGGDGYFENSKVRDLSNLKYIKGSANFYKTEVKDLSKLEEIGGSANFIRTQKIDLRNLKSIGENARFEASKVEDLRSLETIGGDAEFKESEIKNLDNLKTVGKSAVFTDTKITHLTKLESIGDHAFFTDGKIIDLRNLKTIGGQAGFTRSQIKDLGSLEYIGGTAIFTDIKTPNTNDVGEDENSKTLNLDNLREIEGSAYFENSNVKSLNSLVIIGSAANFENSDNIEMKNLTKIGGKACFKNSKITDLGSLESIGEDALFTYFEAGADFSESEIRNLGKLKTVAGPLDIQKSKIEDLSSLEKVGSDLYIKDSNFKKEDFYNVEVGNYIIDS